MNQLITWLRAAILIVRGVIMLGCHLLFIMVVFMAPIAILILAGKLFDYPIILAIPLILYIVGCCFLYKWLMWPQNIKEEYHFQNPLYDYKAQLIRFKVFRTRVMARLGLGYSLSDYREKASRPGVRPEELEFLSALLKEDLYQKDDFYQEEDMKPGTYSGEGGSLTEPPPGASMTDSFLDGEGREHQRGSTKDFETLENRVMQMLEALPGFEGDDELNLWLSRTYNHYQRGEYQNAYNNLRKSLEKLPAFKPYLFNYIRICERVLKTPLADEDRPSELSVRCKYCGRHAPYEDPNTPTFGFDSSANSCEHCGRMYPMPSWTWDSPEGRAYSYYRMSFSDDVFYDEFERDYNPHPQCKRRQKPS